ncbi:MAG TPA: MlaD family protein [Opitutus sp.]|nr:MlaD family protein [Opitutus sp.]
MKSKAGPAIVGAFVIGAFVLGTIALLSFGGVSFFSKPERFIVNFDESIHGLDLGSPVKLRGVRIGRVVELNVRYIADRNHSVVAVVCELNRDIITDNRGMKLDVSSRAELQRLVDQGMRARLEIQALATGMLFVGLDFVDPAEFPAQPMEVQPRYVVVPAMPSAISEFQANLTEILNDVKKMDFAGISAEFKGLLVDTRKEIVGLNLKATLEQWQRTGAQVEALAASPEIKESFVNLNAALSQLRTVLANVDAQIGPAGKELTATLVEAKASLEAFGATANAAHRFIASQSGLGDEATRTLQQLSSAAEAVQRLADFIERNPQALITGKKR